MGNISKHQSTIKRLAKINSEKNPTKLISVVYMNDDGTIDYPENCAPGVLVVPKPMTIENWEKAGIQENQNSKKLK